MTTMTALTAILGFAIHLDPLAPRQNPTAAIKAARLRTLRLDESQLKGWQHITSDPPFCAPPTEYRRIWKEGLRAFARASCLAQSL